MIGRISIVEERQEEEYCKTSNISRTLVGNKIVDNSDVVGASPDISRTLVGNKIVDNSDVVGASPVGAAPTTSSFST